MLIGKRVSSITRKTRGRNMVIFLPDYFNLPVNKYWPASTANNVLVCFMPELRNLV